MKFREVAFTARAHAKAAGDAVTVGAVYNNLAINHLDAGELVQAAGMLERSREAYL